MQKVSKNHCSRDLWRGRSHSVSVLQQREQGTLAWAGLTKRSQKYKSAESVMELGRAQVISLLPLPAQCDSNWNESGPSLYLRNRRKLPLDVLLRDCPATFTLASHLFFPLISFLEERSLDHFCSIQFSIYFERYRWINMQYVNSNRHSGIEG